MTPQTGPTEARTCRRSGGTGAQRRQAARERKKRRGEQTIAAVIASRYSIDDQIAILRQKDSKPEEYQAFYDFAEEVKRKVTAEFAAREGA